MKLYTKKGDDGTTSLIGGKRVKKCDARVEAYGTADELISWLGLVRAHLGPEFQDYQGDVLEIQKHLMDISAWLACETEVDFLRPLEIDKWMSFLEGRLDSLTALLGEKFSFVIPGPPAASAECHVARTVCRRCERDIVAIEQKTPADALCLRYINRLSDYLFALAQVVEKQS